MRRSRCLRRSANAAAMDRKASVPVVIKAPHRKDMRADSFQFNIKPWSLDLGLMPRHGRSTKLYISVLRAPGSND
jgi:hypothetical protein